MPEKFYSRAKDKSLQAYKDRIRGIYTNLTGKSEDTMTDEEWIANLKKFWSKAKDNSDTATTMGSSTKKKPASSRKKSKPRK